VSIGAYMVDVEGNMNELEKKNAKPVKGNRASRKAVGALSSKLQLT
jgi:hypothetical protein